MSAPAETGARQRIVAAAVALFAEQGYDATSVNQVVARAGVAKGALYHHFESKDDLLYEVYRELVDRQLAGLRAILAEGWPPAATLRALIDDLVGQHRGQRGRGQGVRPGEPPARRCQPGPGPGCPADHPRRGDRAGPHRAGGR